MVDRTYPITKEKPNESQQQAYESGRRQALNETGPRPHQSLPNRTMVDKFGNVVAPPSTTVPGWEEEDFDRPDWPWWAWLMPVPYWGAQEIDVAMRKHRRNK